MVANPFWVSWCEFFVDVGSSIINCIKLAKIADMYTVNSYWIQENINFSLNLFKGKWRKIKKLDFISVPSVRSISQNLMFYPYKPWGKVFSSSLQQFTNITYKTISRSHHIEITEFRVTTTLVFYYIRDWLRGYFTK